MHDAFDIVRNAVASGNSERLEAAELVLRQAYVGQALSPADLPACQRLDSLLRSASAFYGGLISVMKIQLQGYGNSVSKTQPQPGIRFTVEA